MLCAIVMLFTQVDLSRHLGQCLQGSPSLISSWEFDGSLVDLIARIIDIWEVVELKQCFLSVSQ